jgi:hypothetical protein
MDTSFSFFLLCEEFISQFYPNIYEYAEMNTIVEDKPICSCNVCYIDRQICVFTNMPKYKMH